MRILIALVIFFTSGCSVHKFWNGTDLASVSYVSIDKSGLVSANVKGPSYFEDVFKEAKKKNSDKHIVDSVLKKLEGRSTLFVWGPDYNGAMINDKGRTCLQAATYAKATNIDTSVSSSLVALLGQIKFDLSNNPGNDKAIAFKLTEALTALQAQSQQSTYLSVGMFGICLLCANDAISEEQASEAINYLITSSALNSGSEKEVEIYNKKMPQINANN